MPYSETTDYETEIIRSMLDDGEPIALVAIHRYTVTRQPDGWVLVISETNDDNDDGFPDGKWEQWEMQFANVDDALRHTGKCRVGVSGVIVTVTLDGKELR